MTDESKQFEDQDLKMAVHHLRGAHKARPELRDQVVRRLTELRLKVDGSGTSEPRASQRPASTPASSPCPGLRWLALATVALLTAGGVLGHRYYRQSQDANAENVREASLIGAMVAIHDLGPATAPGLQPLATPLSNTTALFAEASNRLGHAVPAVDFGAQGWTLDAADLCNVGTERAVRFHFNRGPRSMSIISIPGSSHAKAGSQYQMLAGGHPIAVSAGNGSLTVVVGDTACAMGDTVALRNAIGN